MVLHSLTQHRGWKQRHLSADTDDICHA